MELLQTVDYQMMLIVALATTLIVSAINIATPEWVKPGWLLPLAALIVTMLRVPIEEGLTLEDLQGLLFTILLTWAIAVLFYKLVGPRFVEKFFEAIWKRIQAILDGSGGNNQQPPALT